MDANADLKAIKVIYKDNENKREDLKKAMAADNAEEVKKIADSVVDIINDGAAKGVSALEKDRPGTRHEYQSRLCRVPSLEIRRASKTARRF